MPVRQPGQTLWLYCVVLVLCTGTGFLQQREIFKVSLMLNVA